MIFVATAPDKSPDRIAGMFDAIAPRYDLLNHLLSAGSDATHQSAAIVTTAATCMTRESRIEWRTPNRTGIENNP